MKKNQGGGDDDQNAPDTAAGPRLAALVGALSRELLDWQEMRTGMCEVTSLPVPDVVLLEPDAGAGVELGRYTRLGEFCGNTWHLSLADAMAQAETEFGAALGPWTETPAGASASEVYTTLCNTRNPIDR